MVCPLCRVDRSLQPLTVRGTHVGLTSTPVWRLQDLRRCAIDRASAVFIFADKFATNTDGEDSRTILRALSIKRYGFRGESAQIGHGHPSASNSGPFPWPRRGVMPVNSYRFLHCVDDTRAVFPSGLCSNALGAT